ncbi:Clan MH, family M18, aspartyl aminopeptidase-like metallopeptidase [Histomonas meleagridis]|uniref:Clan MH, family M18, aspartyl aminopeptidase-like metallopeptidase n=1 Tax=Histomonas meleagridis TaxID=135588 RepID=UPI0035599060|nr:Clan MH, family M18, aspartyl aminopeptidase-like metallopeptidase [Histomonas meleagridis]KAH0798486.1 Clan MH, family M18, aspartyl aminopeptidase-like metallopeptidase [Histomonas meleagridis]
MAFNGKGKWETYIDRDLSAGGKVLYKADNGEIQTKLFNSKRGVAIIPNVGLDLKPSNSLKTNYNNEKSFNAIIGKKGFSSYVSELIGCKESDILDMDVEFTDSSPPSYNDDLLSSPRLFSQANFYCSLLSFLESSDDTDSVQIIGAFDNQQNNNLSRNSTVFLNEVIHSIFKGKNISEVNSKSIIVSCQSIDGRHPLNKTITDEACAKLGKGVSLNTSFRSPVASEPIGNGFIYNLSENQIQTNTHKNMRTGIPTIGPVLALSTGIRTVDIGIPVLANGSIRETMVWKDVVSMFNLITKIFSNIETLSKFEH